MTFRNLFAVTTWLWRHLSSRLACRTYFWVLAIVLVPAIALRIEAAFFTLRVNRIMSGLSSLRIGETSKSEALSRIPGLRVVKDANRGSGGAGDEWFSVAIPNSRLSEWVLLPTGQAGHETLFSVLSCWGIRYWGLTADVGFNSGKVSDVGYRLMLSTPRPGSPGAVMIGASSRENLLYGRPELSWDTDESPNYSVYHYFKWPDLNTKVYFTRDALPDVVKHAFDLHLGCLWSLAGCETANQLLPGPEQDRLAIERAAIDRLKSPDQCPDRILPGRARDVEDILLVEVKNASPAAAHFDGGSEYRSANFRLLRVLKGKPGRPLDNIGVTRDVSMGELYAHNSAFDLLIPGQRLLLFSGRSLFIDEPCEAMAGSDRAVRTIERALSGISSR
ncbi:MAG TPA: hypothetical protein VFE61_01795 [Candidatus Sulfotelmatobacter sp.]|nr:hypothetical protein [Candidatus Sulfotelmatobacter sp.]